MLEGPARYLFVPLAIAVVFSMLASYLLSRTLVPTLARRLLPTLEHDDGGDGAGKRAGPRASTPGATATSSACARCTARCCACASSAAGSSSWAAWSSASSRCCWSRSSASTSFPAVDTGQMRLHVRAPIGTRIEDTEIVVGHIEEEIRRIIPRGELDIMNDMIGLPTFYNLAFVSTDNVGDQDAEMLMQLAPKHRPDARRTWRASATSCRAKFPGVADLLHAGRRGDPGAELRRVVDDRRADREQGPRGGVRDRARALRPRSARSRASRTCASRR